MQTSVDIEIANGVYTCAIGLQGVREIETATSAPVGEVISRILVGVRGSMERDASGALDVEVDAFLAGYRIADIIEFVRQGLIGGGCGVVDGVEVKVDARRANELVNNYLLPPVSDLSTLHKLAAFIAVNLAQGYQPPEKKSPATDTDTVVKPPQRRKTATSSASPTA